MSSIEYHELDQIGFFMQAVKHTKHCAENNTESPIEYVALLYLLRLQVYYGIFNLSVMSQVELLEYRVDFLLEYQDKKIVIECDGHEFHEKTKEQASRDKKRDRELQKAGYFVLRYSGSDIMNEPKNMLEDVQSVLGRGDYIGT